MLCQDWFDALTACAAGQSLDGLTMTAQGESVGLDKLVDGSQIVCCRTAGPKDCELSVTSISIPNPRQFGT